MQTLPISKVKDRLNELVDETVSTQEHITITKNGSPAAVLVSVDEWESLQETLFWLAQPGVHEDRAQASSEYQGGTTLSEEQVRQKFAAPKRP